MAIGGLILNSQGEVIGTRNEYGVAEEMPWHEAEREDSEPPCVCGHCQDRGTCLGCTSGVCP